MGDDVRVVALYRFARLDDPPAIRAALEAVCRGAGVKGTLLIAPEGINGTIAGAEEDVGAVLDALRGMVGAELDMRESRAPAVPFDRLKVRLKREIVTMGEAAIDPLAGGGHYVDARDWNTLIADPETVVIDTRNAYEVALGSFAGAVDPGTRSFGEFPAWFRANRDTLADRKIAMFCTGGIRCEKATAFLKAEGVEKVYHLKGGILTYLEQVPEADSRWQGECFVFDRRVTVTHGLVPGERRLCAACQRVLAAEGCPSCDHPPRDRGR